MEREKSKFWLLLDCLLLGIGLLLIFSFFFLEDKTVLIDFSAIVDSFLGIEWVYATGLALFIAVFIFIIVFVLLFFVSVFLRKAGINSVIPNLILKKTLGFFTSVFSQKNLWPWLSKSLREFSLVVYSLLLAVILMCFSQGTYPKGSVDVSLLTYLFFLAASYILIRGLHGLGFVQKFEKRLSKQQ